MMSSLRFTVLAIAIVSMVLGCRNSGPAVTSSTNPSSHSHADGDHDHDGHAEEGHSMDSKVAEALSMLAPNDRAQAEAQKYCAVMNDSLLGSMGTPIKLDLNGKEVFICCGGCKAKALRDPDGTLATVAMLLTNNSVR